MPSVNAAISARRNPTCNPTDRARWRSYSRQSSSFRACPFIKRQGRAFLPVDRRPRDLTRRIARRAPVVDQVAKDRRERREPPLANGIGRALLPSIIVARRAVLAPQLDRALPRSRGRGIRTAEPASGDDSAFAGS
jgi:hypothetical protein